MKLLIETTYKLLLEIFHYSASIFYKLDAREFEGRRFWLANCVLKVLHEFWHQNATEESLQPETVFFSDCIEMLSGVVLLRDDNTDYTKIMFKIKIEVNYYPIKI